MLCIIPARSGSKRIPNKNIYSIQGKPLLVDAIQKAQSITNVDRVIVSSDSDHYLDIAKKNGAYVHKRASDISGDEIGVDEAVGRIFFDIVKPNKNDDKNYVLTLFPCIPLLSQESLSKFVKSFLSTKVESGMILKEYSHPIQRALSMSKKNIVSIDHPKYFALRTQDLQVKYHDSGQAYITRADQLRKGLLITNNTYGYVDNLCIDIDNINDLQLVESILEKKQ